MTKLNDKRSFKVNMFKYLIMNALLNTVVCSNISLTGDLCPKKSSQLTCRASRLAGFFCSMRTATEWYIRTYYSSKILLMLNLFFINLFTLTIISGPSSYLNYD